MDFWCGFCTLHVIEPWTFNKQSCKFINNQIEGTCREGDGSSAGYSDSVL